MLRLLQEADSGSLEAMKTLLRTFERNGITGDLYQAIRKLEKSTRTLQEKYPHLQKLRYDESLTPSGEVRGDGSINRKPPFSRGEGLLGIFPFDVKSSVDKPRTPPDLHRRRNADLRGKVTRISFEKAPGDDQSGRRTMEIPQENSSRNIV